MHPKLIVHAKWLGPVLVVALLIVLLIAARRRKSGRKAADRSPYDEALETVTLLVGARSRDRIAEAFLSLLGRSLGLRKLAFLIPDKTHPNLVVLTSVGLSHEAEDLCVPLDGGSAVSEAARTLKPAATRTGAVSSSLSFSLACPLAVGGQLLGVVAAADEGADRLLKTRGELLRDLSSLAEMSLAKVERFERTKKSEDLERQQKEQRHRMLSTYLSPVIAKALVDYPELLQLEGAQTEASVLFADICDFTTICESGDARAIVADLNEYLGVMSEIITRHRGVLDKFVGDQIMAYWIPALSQADHTILAARAAIEMRDAQKRLHDEWTSKGRRPIKAGIAVNAGVAVYGHIGSEERKDLTIIGDTVNACARLEKLTRTYGVDVILGGGAYDKVRDRVIVNFLGEQKVKGKEEQVMVYHLQGLV